MAKIEHVTVWEDKTIWVRYEGRSRTINHGEKIPATVWKVIDNCENPVHGVSQYTGKKYTTYK